MESIGPRTTVTPYFSTGFCSRDCGKPQTTISRAKTTARMICLLESRLHYSAAPAKTGTKQMAPLLAVSLRMPGREHGLLAVFRETRQHFGPSLVRQCLEPGEGIAGSFRQRTERQTFRYGARVTDAAESRLLGTVRYPYRHVDPCPDFLIAEETGIGPGE